MTAFRICSLFLSSPLNWSRSVLSGENTSHCFYIQHLFFIMENLKSPKCHNCHGVAAGIRIASNTEAAVLTFAHPIFIRGIFQTPERRIESEITTEEHATSCEVLSLTCFGGNKQTKVCCEAFPGELFHQRSRYLAPFMLQDSFVAAILQPVFHLFGLI